MKRMELQAKMKGNKKNLNNCFYCLLGGLIHAVGMNEASNNSKIVHFLSIYRTRKFSIPTRAEVFDTPLVHLNMRDF